MRTSLSIGIAMVVMFCSDCIAKSWAQEIQIVPLQSDVDTPWNIDKSNEEPKYFEPEKTSIKKRSYHKREEDFLRMNHLTRFGDSEEGYNHAILGRRKRNNASVINFLTKLKYLNSYLKSKEASHNKINYLHEI